MKYVSYYIPKILSLLRITPLVGGLEISDVAFRFVYFSEKMWRLVSIRLEPGILEGGKIKNREKFITALKNLKSNAFPGKKPRKISVVVSLSSISIYSQAFSLPIIKGENLDRAIQLNVEMISPIDISHAYSGWQKIGENQGSLQLEMLSAFIDRAVVDEITQALRAAGFIPVVVESRALSLARLLREEGAGMGIDMSKSYVLVNIDSSGIDFLIIRLGQLYFEYFNPWRDIMDEKGQISPHAFESAVIRNFHQVVNFYGQHWTEPLSEVVLSAVALKDETKRVIADNFPFVVRELALIAYNKGKEDQEIAPEWFIALGCGLRGRSPRSQDREISLLGIDAQEEFRQEQIVLFADFWRVLMPVALGLFLGVFSLSYVFLAQTRSGLESQLLFTSGNIGLKEGQDLQARAVAFNHVVSLFKAAKVSYIEKSTLIEKIQSISASNGVTVSRIYFQDSNTPISLNGEVRADDKLTALKNALMGDPEFTDVNLSLSDVRQGTAGLSFSITFRLRQ